MSEERTTFPSGVLKLEGMLALPEGTSPFSAVILCHPHPLYGGDMYDSVISAIAQALINRGVAVLRFNFRGVGESQGNYGKGKGEQEDAVAVIDYITRRPEVNPDKIGIAGYSFGGGVAFNVALRDYRVQNLALISPVIQDPDWEKLSEYSKPKFLVLRENDEYFPLRKYRPKISKALRQQEYEIFPNTDHSWTGSEVLMAERVAGFLVSSLI